MLPLLFAYLKGKKDEKAKRLEEQADELKRQNKIMLAPNASRSTIIQRMREGKL